MSFLEGWKPKLEWKKQGKDFLVSVSKHLSFDGGNLWCVYLYVYPQHPAFARFNREGDMWDQPHFDCHSYVSYFQPHVDPKTGEVVSYQLGWDYNHDGDSYYTTLETAEDAASVFYDAQRLYEQVESYGKD